MNFLKKSKNRIVIAGGGTAGHVHAGIAIANEMKTLKEVTDILFVGTKRGMESKIVPKHKYKIKFILARGLKRENIFVLLWSLFLVPIAFLQSLFILLRFRPRAVIGVGGYASWALVIAGKFLFIKTYILEQNKVIGFTNRLLLPFVNKIFVSFPDTEKITKKYNKKIVLSGCPIIKKDVKSNQDKKYFNILVFGGSQGAYGLNKIFVDSIKGLNELNKKQALSIYHQTGTYSYNFISQNKSKAEFRYFIEEFIDNMPKIYSKVDLVICRSGASSVFELIYYKKPSILIPLPTSADNHQLKNAQFLQKVGVAEFVEQKDLTADILISLIEKQIHKQNQDKQALLDKFKQVDYLVESSAKLIVKEIL